MTYTIKNYAQTQTLGYVSDNTSNSSIISCTLIGKNYTNYGTLLNENFVYLTENFSSAFPGPANPVQGQVWWDNVNKYLCVWDGSVWQTVYGALTSLSVNTSIRSATLSTSGSITSGNQCIGYFNGAIGANTANTATFTTISASSISASSAITAASFSTTGGGQLSGYFTGAIGANTANTAAFTTVTASGTILGSTNITAGAQVIGYLNGALGANTPNTVVATAVTTTNGGQLTGYLTGVIGANTANSGTFTTLVSGTVTTSAGGQLTGYHTGAIGANSANTAVFTTATINTSMLPGSNALVNLGTTSSNYFGNIVATDVWVANSIVPSANIVASIGSAQKTFQNIYGVNFLGTSTTAKYADLAENYLADADYPAGTVVEFGGEAEITVCDSYMSSRVAGVVSDKPAYLMNSDAEAAGFYVIPVALMGRVWVKTEKPLRAGELVVSSYGGKATSTNTPLTGTLIGKAIGKYDALRDMSEVLVGKV
jgi:hypothetical protein